MGKAKIYVAGIGSGSPADITPAVMEAIRQSDAVIGYQYYFQFINAYLRPGTRCIDTGMKKETARAEQAFELAEQGQTVCVVSSGDAGIYGMAPLICEMKSRRQSPVEVEVLPGISAFQKAASLLGAPIGHDFCVISLSDLMTPWSVIERRIRAAAEADFVTAVYNPKSEGRYWQLYRLKELFLQARSGSTPIGYVRQAGRKEQQVSVTTLDAFDPEQVDMFTIVLIGNSQTYLADACMVTPRGYYSVQTDDRTKLGQRIMIESFRTIERELHDRNIPLGHKWALLHAIHTTADFEMEQLLHTDPDAVEHLHSLIKTGQIRTIVTDVTMAMSGIRRGALERCTQAGIRLAVEEHPDALFVFGNAPTALMELCSLMRKGQAVPGGIIAAPVGFVHVQESKHMVKVFRNVPKLIVEGRKGGSNLAATLVNAILCFDDAMQLTPGRDV